LASLLSILSIRRFRQELRVGHTIQLMTLLILFSNASAVLSYLIVSTNAPLIDSALSSWGRANHSITLSPCRQSLTTRRSFRPIGAWSAARAFCKGPQNCH
jgi:hypothetical protein